MRLRKLCNIIEHMSSPACNRIGRCSDKHTTNHVRWLVRQLEDSMCTLVAFFMDTQQYLRYANHMPSKVAALAQDIG